MYISAGLDLEMLVGEAGKIVQNFRLLHAICNFTADPNLAEQGMFIIKLLFEGSAPLIQIQAGR